MMCLMFQFCKVPHKVEDTLMEQTIISLKALGKVCHIGKQNEACSSILLEDEGAFWHY